MQKVKQKHLFMQAVWNQRKEEEEKQKYIGNERHCLKEKINSSHNINGEIDV